ncbi:MAG: DUF3179 domain-containing (seleno)protein [Bacteroidota bacterium]
MKPTIFSLLGLMALVMISCRPTELPPSPPSPPIMDGSISAIQDEFMGKEIVLAGSQGRNLVVAFERRLPDGTLLDFQTSKTGLPAILEDNEGNTWNMFGEAILGPRTGEKLLPLRGYIGYWFSFGSFFPGLEIYDDSRTVNAPPAPAPSNQNWGLSVQNVYSGAGQDGIPSLETPQIDLFRERDHLENPYYLTDDELIVGIKVGDTYRAYSHAVLNWHEIVNDTIGNEAFSLIYCPLTGTAMAWNRVINGETTTFGVSGLLYNNNVMPYDRNSGSIWSQMREDCVNGPLLGPLAEPIPVIETTWGTWRRMFKSTQILSNQTGIARDYTEYPYGTYRENHDFLAFPLTFDDTRLPRKERVYGVVIDGEAKVYRLQSF